MQASGSMQSPPRLRARGVVLGFRVLGFRCGIWRFKLSEIARDLKPASALQSFACQNPPSLTSVHTSLEPEPCAASQKARNWLMYKSVFAAYSIIVLVICCTKPKP